MVVCVLVRLERFRLHGGSNVHRASQGLRGGDRVISHNCSGGGGVVSTAWLKGNCRRLAEGGHHRERDGLASANLVGNFAPCCSEAVVAVSKTCISCRSTMSGVLCRFEGARHDSLAEAGCVEEVGQVTGARPCAGTGPRSRATHPLLVIMCHYFVTHSHSR